MKNIRSLPFVWLPLLTLWTIIFVLFKNLSIDNIEAYIPLVVYIPISFIFSTQYGLLLNQKKELFFTKISNSSSIIICFLISTISIFSYINGFLDFQRSLLFIVLPLVANLIINEFISLSNKKLVSNKREWDKKNLEIEDQQIKRSKENAISREISISVREKWKRFLKQSLTKYSQDEEIIFEIKRILTIVDFSSYFRNDLSLEELKEIKDSKDNLYVKNILKSIK
tara:strand:- start:1456 stop:2133 length:678 start_codon:yes stop_codon:yes gene_type:complete